MPKRNCLETEARKRKAEIRMQKAGARPAQHDMTVSNVMLCQGCSSDIKNRLLLSYTSSLLWIPSPIFIFPHEFFKLSVKIVNFVNYNV